MIGKKKLSEIRASVDTACAKAGLDPTVWIDEQIGEADRAKPRHAAEIETLMLIRDGLRAAASRKRGRRDVSKSNAAASARKARRSKT
jgi:hypothetical protein